MDINDFYANAERAAKIAHLERLIAHPHQTAQGRKEYRAEIAQLRAA